MATTERFLHLDHPQRFPRDRSISSGVRHSFSASVSGHPKPPLPRPRPTCLCSPTTHPGSFRCARHRRSAIGGGKAVTTKAPSPSPSPVPIREFAVTDGLKLRRSAMVNSLARIGGVEGEVAKRTMAALSRPPSSQNLRRRSEFRPRPSRFSVMCRDQGL
ncbi:PREDICTED: uncharacterized protein LOC104799741 [Tarenaya hassleriana]|uniref:uncharacterized protein LOC104799741 n=1 Tax=Tarenaya hassleriana TaxID=28532 RepID=UPI00053CA966|nr:PREDICTED: uncharacterized protein LOC104799741 [Tarenaya hassleriana]